MKPYGREKNVKGSGTWKTDYHVRIDNKKIENWWEVICKPFTRGRIKQELKKEIDKEISC